MHFHVRLSGCVDYPHGLYRQENVVVQVDERGQEESYLLDEIITQRALRHFLSLWRRGTKRRTQGLTEEPPQKRLRRASVNTGEEVEVAERHD